ncbi:YlxR family protein [Paenibacillus psychroresistens]|uniref:YlxR family protein n=1 Tax=Paenibacillus psychroresistens TaxID=1778678 RepID=A0A6B8RZ35_9BACL|nr:YlxR family protein [Paenibacillus psychroresistens]QGR00119.1 YlxR family protein [Paenibacillus psychroresistens]
MRQRKIPLRKCVACQEMKPKKQLIRVVRTPQEEIQIDQSGKKAGRGAYLCAQIACFKLAQKSKAFDRALKQNVSISIYEQLAQDFIRVEDEYLLSRDEIPDDEQ